MKPILIIKEKNENGKYEFTKEEIEDIIEQAYNSGFADGKVQYQPIYPYYQPTYPSTTPTTPVDEWWKRQVWCGSGNTLTESHGEPNPNIRVTGATSFFQSVPGSESAV